MGCGIIASVHAFEGNRKLPSSPKTTPAKLRNGGHKAAEEPPYARMHLNMAPRTMFEKIWESHLVREIPGEPSLIYIDRHLVHEGTSPQAFAGIEAAERKVRRPDLAFAVMDHSVSTKNRELPILDENARLQFE